MLHLVEQRMYKYKVPVSLSTPVTHPLPISALFWYEASFSADKWRKHHRLISPAFNSTASNQFLPVFNENTLTLINNLKAELGRTQMFNIWDYVFLSLTDTICRECLHYLNTFIHQFLIFILFILIINLIKI